VQEANDPPSSLHSKVFPAAVVSVARKVKLAERLCTVPVGKVSMTVFGGVVSTVQFAIVGVGSVWPPASVARTWKE
jgi:hypothetical protein